MTEPIQFAIDFDAKLPASAQAGMAQADANAGASSARHLNRQQTREKEENGKTVKLLLHWSHRDRTQCQGGNPRPLQPF